MFFILHGKVLHVSPLSLLQWAFFPPPPSMLTSLPMIRSLPLLTTLPLIRSLPLLKTLPLICVSQIHALPHHEYWIPAGKTNDVHVRSINFWHWAKGQDDIEPRQWTMDHCVNGLLIYYKSITMDCWLKHCNKGIIKCIIMTLWYGIFVTMNHCHKISWLTQDCWHNGP